MPPDPLLETVRSNDRARYLSALFASDNLRPHLAALYAFDAEIARIPSLVSEPQLGEIRLQWWMDTLDSLYQDDAVDHPVARALGPAIRQGRLPKTALQNLIHARQRNLYADPVATLNDLEGYFGETESAVFQMAAHILMQGKAAGLSNAAGFAGVAQGVAKLLASAPQWRTRGQCWLPMDVLSAHGATAGDVIAANPSPAVAAAVAQLIAHGEKRLAEAREVLAAAPQLALPAFLPLVATPALFAKLRKAGSAALTTETRVSPLSIQWTIWRSARTGRI